MARKTGVAPARLISDAALQRLVENPPADLDANWSRPAATNRACWRVSERRSLRARNGKEFDPGNGQNKAGR